MRAGFDNFPNESTTWASTSKIFFYSYITWHWNNRFQIRWCWWQIRKANILVTSLRSISYSVFEPWPDSTPDYFKRCMKNCNPPTASKNMQDHFHHEDIAKSQFYYLMLIAVTILSLGSAVFFISVKWREVNQSTDSSYGSEQRGRTEESSLQPWDDFHDKLLSRNSYWRHHRSNSLYYCLIIKYKWL